MFEPRLSRWAIAALMLTLLSAAATRGETPRETAAKIDALLAEEFPSAGADVPNCDDATFLRRVTLDLTGEIPTVQELTNFALDPSPHKRQAAIDRLLDNKHFGQNWARYWRDVIMFRRSDDRALLGANALVTYLTDEFNRGTSWGAIARQFITATGDIQQEGSTGIILAQMGETSDITAEVSRIFLGVQIQCAQCHNHPTDRWKREQFHELAAFFPRITLRPVLANGIAGRSFEVVSVDREPLFGGGPNNNRPRGKLEHFMPDLKDPAAQGTRMQPVFFATGQKLETGSTDQDRRSTLADWMTASGNRWFAKAYVNRMWSELIGAGFSEPVDDLGPDRTPIAPKTFELLAARFVTSNYDPKWLFRTVMATKAYQRQSRSRSVSEETPFAANCSQRLRGDQLYNAVTSVLGIAESTQPTAGRPGYAMLGSPRGQMNVTFGYDPSVRRDEISGSIPQALWMMNSSTTNATYGSRNSASPLARLLADESDNEAVTVEIYLRVLAREPKDAEIAKCLAYVKTVGNRMEAFEDIQWALLNSTEFLHRK